MKISAQEAYAILEQWESAGKRVVSISSLLGPSVPMEGFIALSSRSVALTTGGAAGEIRLSASLTDPDTDFEFKKGRELPSDIKASLPESAQESWTLEVSGGTLIPSPGGLSRVSETLFFVEMED